MYMWRFTPSTTLSRNYKSGVGMLTYEAAEHLMSGKDYVDVGGALYEHVDTVVKDSGSSLSRVETVFHYGGRMWVITWLRGMVDQDCEFDEYLYYEEAA